MEILQRSVTAMRAVKDISKLEFKGTLGQWKIGDRDDMSITINDGSIDVWSIGDVTNKEAMANAKLIEKLPEILEALHELVILKEMKDKKGETKAYKIRKPKAWEDARRVLTEILE